MDIIRILFWESIDYCIKKILVRFGGKNSISRAHHPINIGFKEASFHPSLSSVCSFFWIFPRYLTRNHGSFCSIWWLHGYSLYHPAQEWSMHFALSNANNFLILLFFHMKIFRKLCFNILLNIVLYLVHLGSILNRFDLFIIMSKPHIKFYANDVNMYNTYYMFWGFFQMHKLVKILWNKTRITDMWQHYTNLSIRSLIFFTLQASFGIVFKWLLDLNIFPVVFLACSLVVSSCS